ncbi:MAG TPA: hypothetical protein VFT13_03005 [Candidatus Krumholzibacteria bacterium]|nr:hypothetical protein [Candidatus Krumholzibacteria bacterium]
MSIRSLTGAACALFVLAPLAASAAEPFARVRRYVSSLVVEPRGVRSIGMGSTGAASVFTISSGYVNPAALAWSDAVVLAASRQEYDTGDIDIGLNHTDSRLSGGWALSDDTARDRWRVGGMVGYSREDMNPQVIRTIFLPEGTGETFDIDDYSLLASGAASWTRGPVTIGAGLSVKYLDFTFLDGWALDWGVLTALSFTPGGTLIRPRLGLSVSNLDNGFHGQDVDYELVGETRVGLGLDLASRPVAFAGRAVPVISGSVEYDHVAVSDNEGYWAIGWEVSFVDLLQVRVGLQNDDPDTSAWGLGLGWAFGRLMVRADYAHESWMTFFGEYETNTFGLATGMGF